MTTATESLAKHLLAVSEASIASDIFAQGSIFEVLEFPFPNQFTYWNRFISGRARWLQQSSQRFLFISGQRRDRIGSHRFDKARQPASAGILGRVIQRGKPLALLVQRAGSQCGSQDMEVV